jgi:hypothetical protein
MDRIVPCQVAGGSFPGGLRIDRSSPQPRRPHRNRSASFIRGDRAAEAMPGGAAGRIIRGAPVGRGPEGARGERAAGARRVPRRVGDLRAGVDRADARRVPAPRRGLALRGAACAGRRELPHRIVTPALPGCGATMGRPRRDPRMPGRSRGGTKPAPAPGAGRRPRRPTLAQLVPPP